MVTRRAVFVCVALALVTPTAATPQLGSAQERTLVTSFGDVAALAVGRREIFVAAAGGIAVYDFVDDVWRPPLAPRAGYPPIEFVASLAYDGFADLLWLGAETGELLKLPLTFDRWEPAGFRARAPIIRIVPDAREGALWIGTPQGWYRVRDDGSLGRFMLRADQVPLEIRQLGERDPAFEAVRGTAGLDAQLRRFPVSAVVAGERRGIYFVGTEGGGLVRVDVNTLERAPLPFGTLSRGVGAVAVDGARIWFAGDGQGPRDGVATADRELRRWTQFEATTDGAPRGFVARIEPAPDALWFAASDGTYRLDRRGLRDGPPRPSDWTWLHSRSGLPADQSTAVAPTADGAWIGTLRGLARVDASARVTATFLEGRRILDLASAGDTLWVATDAGLYVSVAGAAPVAGPGVESSPALRSGPVIGVAAHAGQRIVLVPDAHYRLENGAWAGPVREATTLGLGTLYRLLIDDGGSVWIAGERGIARLAAGRPPRAWLVPMDVPVGPVRGLALDGEFVWVATPAGAFRIDPSR